MKFRLFQLTCAVLASVMLFSGAPLPAVALDNPPPTPPPPAHGPGQQPPGVMRDQVQDLSRMDALAADGPSAASVQPQATGGPDDFGYTWNDDETFSWIDAKALGHNSNLYGGDVYTGSVNIGFTFPFYENSYSSLYFSTKGLISFGGGGSWYNNAFIPQRGVPDNFIAAFWDDLGMYKTSSRPNAGIFYYQGGTAPNRFLVVEWYQGDRYGGSGSANYTYEIVLHETGDIVMQYFSLSGLLQSATVGIEDASGLSGLLYLYNSTGLSNGKAIRFIRPGPAARVSVYPLYQGQLVSPGQILTFTVNVRNTGELGADTYDLSATSTWPVTLYLTAGGPAVTDTGAVPQGSEASVLAEIQVPGGALVGQADVAAVTARSTLNPLKSRTVSLQTAIPTAFAQVYQDTNDGAMQLYLAHPTGQLAQKATSDYQYGYDPAVTEMPNGNFAYVWDRWHCIGTNCIGTYNIEYALLDPYGQVVRGVTLLTDHSAATLSTYDYWPAVAATPDGHLGVAWRQEIVKPGTTWTYNYNVFFAILDAAGQVTYGPVSLTNSAAWGNGSYGTTQYFGAPQLAATGDNRFVLTWAKETRAAGCTVNDCYLDDIYYTVRDTGGNAVKAITKFTADTTGSSYESYWGPNLTSLASNRALLTWQRGSNGDIYYAVLDSAGQVFKDKTDLSGGGPWDYGPDAVQLSSGNIVVAWTGETSPYTIRYAVLDPAYNRTAGPTTLRNPAAASGSDYVSVAADNAGHAILTWIDAIYPRSNLYYALVDGNGAILTAPMIFRTSEVSSLYTSYLGNGNTSWSASLAAGVDLAVWPDSAVAFGEPSGQATATVHVANHGQTPATGVVLTATLDANLTYLGDSSGLTPVVGTHEVTWDFSQLGFLEAQQFDLYLGVPGGAAQGDRYPVTLEVAADEGDATGGLAVVVPFHSYLPLALR